MITVEKYQKISGRWEGEIYQTVDRMFHRLSAVSMIAPIFAKKRVLEIGMNAGLFAYEICKFCTSYVGIEPDETYFRQAQETIKEIAAPCEVTTVNGTLANNLDICANVDSVMACSSLYLLDKKEVDALSETIFPHCGLVLIQDRRAKRPENVSKLGLHKFSPIQKYLEENNFYTEVYIAPEERFFMVIGRK